MPARKFGYESHEREAQEITRPTRKIVPIWTAKSTRRSQVIHWEGEASPTDDNDLSYAIGLRGMLESAVKMLVLQDNWNGEGALRIQKSTWDIAVSFLTRTIKSVYKRRSGNVLIPKMSACADGTIDLFWNEAEFRLLANIRPMETGESGYSFETNDGFRSEGFFNPVLHDIGIFDCLSK